MKKDTENKKKPVPEEEDDEVTRYRRELWVKSMHAFYADVVKAACRDGGKGK